MRALGLWALTVWLASSLPAAAVELPPEILRFLDHAERQQGLLRSVEAYVAVLSSESPDPEADTGFSDDQATLCFHVYDAEKQWWMSETAGIGMPARAEGYRDGFHLMSWSLDQPEKWFAKTGRDFADPFVRGLGPDLGLGPSSREMLNHVTEASVTPTELDGAPCLCLRLRLVATEDDTDFNAVIELVVDPAQDYSCRRSRRAMRGVQRGQTIMQLATGSETTYREYAHGLWLPTSGRDWVVEKREGRLRWRLGQRRLLAAKVNEPLPSRPLPILDAVIAGEGPLDLPFTPVLADEATIELPVPDAEGAAATRKVTVAELLAELLSEQAGHPTDVGAMLQEAETIATELLP